MDEYINRQELIASIKNDDDPNFGKWDALFHAKYADAADVVEVVRCKDCKHWQNGDCYRLELSRPMDFCSYGERI